MIKKIIKNNILILLFVLIGTFYFTDNANALNLWSYEQTFNELNTADLNGQDSWSGNAAFDVVTTGTPYEGAKHVYITGGATNIQRNITAIESGTMYFSMKRGSNSSGYCYTLLRGSSGSEMYIIFQSDGKIQVYNNTSYPAWSQSYSANTYYRVGVAFESSSGSWEGLSENTFKLSLDDGAWSTAYGLYSDGTVNNIDIEYGGNDCYFDYISPLYEPAPAGGALIDGFSITEF